MNILPDDIAKSALARLLKASRLGNVTWSPFALGDEDAATEFSALTETFKFFIRDDGGGDSFTFQIWRRNTEPDSRLNLVYEAASRDPEAYDSMAELYAIARDSAYDITSLSSTLLDELGEIAPE